MNELLRDPESSDSRGMINSDSIAKRLRGFVSQYEPGMICIPLMVTGAVIGRNEIIATGMAVGVVEGGIKWGMQWIKFLETDSDSA